MKRLFAFFTALLMLTLVLCPNAGLLTVTDHAAEALYSAVTPGDLDENGIVDNNDAIYLLYATIFGEALYPLNQYCDFDNSGSVDNNDAIYLLYHTIFGATDYPLYNTGNMRRVVSNEQPMWIVHIDTWNYADPQKIIDLIPEDIKPYVVFNISLSIGTDDDGNFLRSGDGYETAKSWLRVCAENQVWAMIQPASGGPVHYEDLDPRYDDYEETLYAEFFRDYPNFIGFNYCEQFWGFDQEGISPSAKERWTHFAGLLELANKYGGYLVVSWCGNQWSPNINPLAMLKQVPVFEEACSEYSENFILCEKYTQHSYINDMESLVYGYYLSGYAGNVGVRYDETGWTDGDAEDDNSEYRVSTGLPVQLERMFLNGYTVIDGPELIWADCFTESWSGTTDSEGYKSRTWDTFDQFDNVAVDMFRKVIEGELRIPTREEVIDRTKIAIKQNVSSGNNDAKYSTYSSLFEGLYQQETDGALRDNHSFYKSTGRYPTIPTIYGTNDELAEKLTIYNQSSLATQWYSIAKKVSDLNALFPEEYTGDLYAGRYENTWILYNPYKYESTATSNIPFKYNTAESAQISMSRYSSGVMTEYADSINFYLNNYDEDSKSTLRTDTIKIYGASSQPEVTYTNRGINNTSPKVTTSWANGVLTVTVLHNGPLDITIKCQGNETDRETEYTKARLVEPRKPAVYTGELQYEGECFDYKNSEVVKNGYGTGVNGYTGQGYIKLKKQWGAAVKDIVTVLENGTYNLVIRYVADANVNNYDLYVNGSKVGSVSLSKTSNMSAWSEFSATVNLNSGENKIELKANGTPTANVYIDNFTVSKK